MPRLIKGRTVVDDARVLVRAAGSLDDVPQDAATIVPLALWLANRDPLRARGTVGVLLAPAEDPFALAEDIASLSVIAVDFPAFTDGRGYSTARLLRERLGYKGEVRAVGDVQRDQLYYLSQVGFDAFALAEERDDEAAVASLRDFSDGYQATNVRTPWFRRRAVPDGSLGSP